MSFGGLKRSLKHKKSDLCIRKLHTINKALPMSWGCTLQYAPGRDGLQGSS